jgi:hypothetical protein
MTSTIDHIINPYNVKILNLQACPEVDAYRLSIEAGGSMVCVDVTSEAILGTMLALFRGELDLVIHLDTKTRWPKAELVKARAA